MICLIYYLYTSCTNHISCSLGSTYTPLQLLKAKWNMAEKRITLSLWTHQKWVFYFDLKLSKCFFWLSLWLPFVSRRSSNRVYWGDLIVWDSLPSHLSPHCTIQDITVHLIPMTNHNLWHYVLVNFSIHSFFQLFNSFNERQSDPGCTMFTGNKLRNVIKCVYSFF